MNSPSGIFHFYINIVKMRWIFPFILYKDDPAKQTPIPPQLAQLPLCRASSMETQRSMPLLWTSMPSRPTPGPEIKRATPTISLIDTKVPTLPSPEKPNELFPSQLS
jgi:hypothetical protein